MLEENNIARTAFSIIAVCAMVTSGIAGLSGNAVAVHDCGSTDALVYGFSFGHVNKDKCTNNHVAHAVEDVREAEADQTKSDIYAALTAQNEQSEAFGAVYDNYLNDTESIAWLKVEQAVAEAYENGSTKAEAKVAAKEAIKEYYSIKQENLAVSWNTTLASYRYMSVRAAQESGITQDGWDEDGGSQPVRNGTEYNFVSFKGFEDQSGYYATPYKMHQVTYRTVNNTKVTVTQPFWRVINAKDDGTPIGGVSSYDVALNSTLVSNSKTGGTEAYEVFTENYPDRDAYVTKLIVNPPSSGYSNETVMDMRKYTEKWNSIEQKNQDLQTEADAFVDSIWQDLEDDNIDTTDVISNVNRMFQYGTDAQNGSGFYDVIGATAAMGLSTPNLEGTGTMTVTIPDSGNTYEGLVFARNVPSGEWQVGETYDPANIEGPVQLGTTGGELLELERNFTIDSATNTDGEEVDKVQTVEYNYQTENTSSLNQKFSDLLNFTEQLEERQNAIENSGSGSGGNSGFGLSFLKDKFAGIPLWAFLGAGGIALFAISQRN